MCFYLRVYVLLDVATRVHCSSSLLVFFVLLVDACAAFWTGGSSGAGHCTIGAVEADTIFSTDYPNKGFIGHTTVGDINAHWTDLTFAGWAKAYFPNGVTQDGQLLNMTKGVVFGRKN